MLERFTILATFPAGLPMALDVGRSTFHMVRRAEAGPNAAPKLVAGAARA